MPKCLRFPFKLGGIFNIKSQIWGYCTLTTVFSIWISQLRQNYRDGINIWHIAMPSFALPMPLSSAEFHWLPPGTTKLCWVQPHPTDVQRSLPKSIKSLFSSAVLDPSRPTQLSSFILRQALWFLSFSW